MLKQQLTKLEHDIDEKKALLKSLIKSGKIAVHRPGEFLNTKNDSDASQPALRRVTEDMLQQIMGEMVRGDLDYHDATSHLEAIRFVRERNLDKLSDELETRVAVEFEKDPRAAALMHQIDEAANLGESNDPAPRLAVLAGARNTRSSSKNSKPIGSPLARKSAGGWRLRTRDRYRMRRSANWKSPSRKHAERRRLSHVNSKGLRLRPSKRTMIPPRPNT